MPASDQCEPQVIRAFEKAGWRVLQRQFIMRIRPDEFVYADLQVQNTLTTQAILIIEVKCFASRRSELDDFYHAVGQYLTYRALLTLKDISDELYLAVPEDFYQRFFARSIVQLVINDAKINIVRIDLAREEIAGWSS